MHPGRYSLILLIVLHLTIKSTIAITGCTVILINQTSARRKVLCADPKGQIEYIPKGLPQTTDMLIISNQNIASIGENDFVSISELTTLLLTSSNLRKIHGGAFQYLTHLMVLDLSGNSLTISRQSLPVEVFVNLSELRYLRLSGNPLGLIPDLFFKPMSVNLRKVYLDKCNMTISPRAFKDVYNIEELDLRESGLVGLSPPMETDLREMKSLKSFLIGGNHFLCDCRLRWFYFFVTQIQDSVTVVPDGDKEARCSGPEKLSGRRFPAKDERHQLRYLDFVCLPQCEAIGQRRIVLEPGAAVNLTCACFSDPIQRLSWTKNGHSVEDTANKYRIFHDGKETFRSTLSIAGLRPVDSGNWSCAVDRASSRIFSVTVVSRDGTAAAAANAYVLVGLGSSLLLVALVVVVLVLFCRRGALGGRLRYDHPMVICGYDTTTTTTRAARKASIVDGDLPFRYGQQDGRCNTTFYENTMPRARAGNHLCPDDLKAPPPPLAPVAAAAIIDSETLLKKYCGCKSLRSEDGPDGRPPPRAATQCPFHGSSGTLTRVPGERPCPVHGSTATLPSRLSSSRKVAHRSGCPAHPTTTTVAAEATTNDNVSVRSLRLDPVNHDKVKPHRCKSVGKLTADNHVGYRPCPLHGDVLAAITETTLEPTRLSKRTHSKVVQERSGKIPSIGCDSRSGPKQSSEMPSTAPRQRPDHGALSQTLTSPVQSSLSSSPLLTADVHGTLV